MISEGIFTYWEQNAYRKIKYSTKSKIHELQDDNNNNETIGNNVNEDDQLYKPLIIDQLQGVFYFLAIGVGISILSFIIEILILLPKI